MNRVEFAHSIKSQYSIYDSLMAFFEQIMGLYNMIGCYQIQSINLSSTNPTGPVQFDVRLNDEDSLNHLEEAIAQNHSTVTVYQHTYALNTLRKSNQDLTITFQGCL